MNTAFFGRSLFSSEKARSLQSVDSERVQSNYTLSDQLATFSSYSAEWAEKAAREQSTAHRAYKSIIFQNLNFLIRTNLIVRLVFVGYNYVYGRC